jgi:GH43 family beta-xylosidase
MLVATVPLAGHSFGAETGEELTYMNPLKPERAADPWVYKHTDGAYYFMTTAGGFSIWKSETLSGLATGERTVVWTPPTTGPNTRDFWAPELHHIDGKWYIYYTATSKTPGDKSDPLKRRTFVLENNSADPTQGRWTDRGQIYDPSNDYWAIDGTVLEHNGELYFSWSGKPYDYQGGEQRLYIAKLSDPVTIGSSRVEISRPTYDWEKAGSPINEAPQFLKRNGEIYVVYSASHCSTDDYKLGAVVASEDANLLDPASWTKHPTPLFIKSEENGVYGPGHNSFTTSPDGTEDYILYHANPEAGLGCGGNRQLKLQKFTWGADGMPDFGTPVANGVKLPLPSGEQARIFVEAETGNMEGGATLSSNAPHYTGAGYVVLDGAGESVTWTVETNEGKEHQVDFRYANLSDALTLELYLNGARVEGGLDLLQTSTSVWADYKLVRKKIKLKKGTNTIMVTANSTTPIYLDNLTVYSELEDKVKKKDKVGNKDKEKKDKDKKDKDNSEDVSE